jgi:hypothetical protein
MRVTHHLAVLALLAVMSLSGLGSRWNESPSVVLAAATTPVPVVAPSAPGIVVPAAPAVVNSLSTSPASVGTTNQTAGSPTPAGALSASAPPSPPQVTRTWVQNFRSIDLYDGPNPEANKIGSAPQFSTFELVEQFESGRSKLLDTGDGNGRMPQPVWADLKEFGPSGPPKYQYELSRGSISMSCPGAAMSIPPQAGGLRSA